MWLRQAAHVHNNYQHTSTKLTPADCLYGFTAKLPGTITKKIDPMYNFVDYFYELRYKLQSTYKYAKRNIIKTKEARKKIYDQRTNTAMFSAGQKVLLLNPTKLDKFSQNWIGPYEVTDANGTNTTIKMGNKKKKKYHNNRLKLYIPRII